MSHEREYRWKNVIINFPKTTEEMENWKTDITEKVKEKLLNTKNTVLFAEIIFSEKIKYEAWQADKEISTHHKKLREKEKRGVNSLASGIVYEHTEFFRYSAKKAEEERKRREQEEKNKKD